MKKVILVNDYVSLNQGVTPEEGKVIYSQIIDAFKKGDMVVLDFKDVTLMTTAFLNVVIGTLYQTYTSQELQHLLNFDHLTAQTIARIKKVTENAKLFYKNRNDYRQTINEVINVIK